MRELFDGEHSFRVESLGEGRSRLIQSESLGEGRSRLIQSESFSGLLAGLLLRRYGADTEAGFQAVNEALKTRSETLTATVDADSVAA